MNNEDDTGRPGLSEAGTDRQQMRILRRVRQVLSKLIPSHLWINEEEGEVRFNLAAGETLWTVRVSARPRSFIKMVSLFPTKVPEERCEAMADALNRANAGLPAGCFEMDEYRVVTFRATIPVLTSRLDPEALRWMLSLHGVLFERYYKAFLAVAFGGVLPAVAIGEVEKDGGEAGQEHTEEGEEAKVDPRWN
jgi:hypothetical protein